MKFLADMGISRSSVLALRDVGHEVVHLREEGLQRMGDPDILSKARNEERIVLTCDLDFGDLLASGIHDSPSVVIIRLRDQRPIAVTPRLLHVASSLRDELAAGSVITVEESRYRVRQLPIQPRATD